MIKIGDMVQIKKVTFGHDARITMNNKTYETYETTLKGYFTVSKVDSDTVMVVYGGGTWIYSMDNILGSVTKDENPEYFL